MTIGITEIEIPSFDFTAFYYPQILEALIQFKRQNVPELSDESPQEPLIQLLRAFAAVGHLNNTLTDLVANECTLPTAQLTSTVRNMLRLIDFELRSAQPAQTDIIYELAQVLFSSQQVVSANAQVATVGSVSQPSRTFEALEALLVTRTDKLSSALGVEDPGDGVGVPSAPAFTDFTTLANDGSGGNDFAPWATPVGGVGSNYDTIPTATGGREGDSLMFGHTEAMWDELEITLLNPAAEITGVWEYYDGNTVKAQPTAVADNGPNITLDLTDYLGTTDLTGTPIRVVYNQTGAFEDLFSDFVGGVNIVKTQGLLGQTTVSLVASDYTVGSEWERFTGLVDNTIQLTASDVVEFDLPQSLTENWALGTFNGVTAFWMRFRIISVGVPTVPDIDLVRIDTGKQYVKRLVTQGVTQSETLGSSDGTANQTFLSSKTNFLDETDVLVIDGVTWTRVTNFLGSKPTDRHYRVELTTDDRARFIFGDGAAGAIPPIGVNNISATYRHSAHLDGNVGARTLVRDRTGLTLVAKVYNPRTAVGWEEAQGASEASLAKAKIEGPASLRTRDVAIGPDDIEVLATRASTLDADVIKITRAKAIEEGFGPKTVELVVVAAGASLLTQDQLDAVDTFYNGDQFTTPVKPKRLIANQEVTSVNYAQKPIDVNATVFATGNITALQIKNALIQLIQPEAVKADGVTFEWEFGGKVPYSRIVHEIFEVDETIREVDITGPGGINASSDILLLPRELPVAGVIQITVQKPS